MHLLTAAIQKNKNSYC